MTKFIEHRNGRRTASKRVVVLYHGGCTDGFTAAWAAFRALGAKAEYIAVEHQVPPPEGLTGKTIYLLDFTYARDIMEQLIAQNVRVTALDHHVSAREATMMTSDYRYDNDKSGARIAWEYFHPNEPVPLLVRIVEDQDLHRYAIAETRAVADWLDLYDFDFKLYTKLARTLGSVTGLRRALRRGEMVRQYRDKCIERLVANAAYEIQFAEFRVRAVNTELYHSEIATAIASGHPFGVVWRMRPNGIYVSLRSDEHGVNVAELAQRYGGGGHFHAAGFLVHSLNELPFHPIEEII